MQLRNLVEAMFLQTADEARGSFKICKDGDGSRIVTAKNSYFYLVTVAAAQCSAKRICEHSEKARANMSWEHLVDAWGRVEDDAAI